LSEIICFLTDYFIEFLLALTAIGAQTNKDTAETFNVVREISIVIQTQMSYIVVNANCKVPLGLFAEFIKDRFDHCRSKFLDDSHSARQLRGHSCAIAVSIFHQRLQHLDRAVRQASPALWCDQVRQWMLPSWEWQTVMPQHKTAGRGELLLNLLSLVGYRTDDQLLALFSARAHHNNDALGLGWPI
jgi:hypothetical protein